MTIVGVRPEMDVPTSRLQTHAVHSAKMSFHAGRAAFRRFPIEIANVFLYIGRIEMEHPEEMKMKNALHLKARVQFVAISIALSSALLLVGGNIVLAEHYARSGEAALAAAGAKTMPAAGFAASRQIRCASGERVLGDKSKASPS